MYKKILLFFVFLFSFVGVSASNLAPVISSIGYTGNLGEDTIIEIKGKNLSECRELSIKGKNILILSGSDTKITYYFKSGYFTNGFIDLKCGDKAGSKDFVFPYIDKIDADIEGLERVYWITGKNFVDGTSVYLGSGKRITQNQSSEVLIIGDIPHNTTDNTMYVSYNNLKSNLVEVDLKVPYIDYIEADNGFIPGNKIRFHGKNLNWKLNSYIMIDDFKIPNFWHVEDDNSIEFVLPELLGNSKVSFFGKGIGSNELSIFIVGNRPTITNGYIRGEYVNNKYIKTLYLVGNGFDTNNDNVYVYNNGSKKSVSSIEDGIIKLENYELNPGNNFIYIDINGVHSNIFNVYEKEENPYINYIEPEKIEGTKRILKLGLGDFDKSTDYIYYKGSKITPISCQSDSCRVKVNSSDLTGYFSVSKANGKKSLSKYFDITDGKYPVIYDIEFIGDIKAGFRFKISGINFDDSTISVSNLAEKENLDISNTSIEGRLLYSYDSASKSSITIKKYGKTSTLSFIGDNLSKKKYNGHGIIKNIENSAGEKILKVGNKLVITGYGFHFDNTLLIGSAEYNINFISSNEFTVDLQSDFKAGEYTFKIKNILGNTSSGYKTKIFSSNLADDILLTLGTKTEKDLKAIYNYKDEFLYSVIVSNFVDDLTITNLSFKIKDYDPKKKLGTFKLKLGNTTIGESQVSSKGLITFDGFNLEKNYSGNTLKLFKTSSFYNHGSYEITIDKMEAYYRGTNNSVNNFNLDSLKPYTMNILDNNIYMCIDSLDDNSNCIAKGIDKKEIVQETKKITPVEPPEPRLTDDEKKNQIYQRIDKLIDDYISRVSMKSLKKQMDTYKIFKDKIRGIILRNSNSPLKEYLDYFYNRIDNQFKIVFKEYFNLKK